MAVPNAKTCFYRPSSSWVHAFILLCDGSMAVWFRREGRTIRGVHYPGPPGVCCWYPRSTTAMWELAIVWASAGKFVHRFLYKKLGYKLIRPPCPALGCGEATTCCPSNTIPQAVVCTIVPNTCSAAAGQIGLVYNTTSTSWKGSGTLGSLPHTIQLEWKCGGTQIIDFTMKVTFLDSCGSNITLVPFTGHCSPLSCNYEGLVLPGACGCSPEDDNVNLVVTP